MGYPERVIKLQSSAFAAANLADIRTEINRNRWGRKTHPRVCTDCGELFDSESGDPRRYCPQCGSWRMLDAAQQLRLREGPVYRKAVTGHLRHWLAEARRLGLPTDPDG